MAKPILYHKTHTAWQKSYCMSFAMPSYFPCIHGKTHVISALPYPWLFPCSNQSVTSRLETSRYRDFSQFFESIGLGLENFGLEKKSRYRSRKYLVSKKSLGIGLENIWSRKKVSVSVSKTLVSKKVSVSVSKILVSKKVSVTT